MRTEIGEQLIVSQAHRLQVGREDLVQRGFGIAQVQEVFIMIENRKCIANLLRKGRHCFQGSEFGFDPSGQLRIVRIGRP
ncbi:hypothetical protein D3C71_2118720 [compost metagenome]